MSKSKTWACSATGTFRRCSRPVRNERGAALLIVLVALIGLTALAAAGMINTETDLRASQNQQAGTTAFYLADAGVQEYLATAADPTATDTFAYAHGTAIVSSSKLLDLPSDRALYRIQSVSKYTSPQGTETSRVVTRVALYSEGTVTAEAAFASGSGLLKNGGAGTISGRDWAPAGNPDCPNSPGPDVAGVAVPPSGYAQSGGGLVPDGEPDVFEASDALALLESTGVDWDGIVNGGLITPDYTIPPDSWPNFGSLPADAWPVIYATGDATASPGNSGRGTLIVRNNLAMNGSFEWDGIVLVGGYVTSNGYQTIQGAVVTGLNLLLGETTPSSDVGNGNKVFKYHSCYLKLASRAAFGGLAEVPGSWAEKI